MTLDYLRDIPRLYGLSSDAERRLFTRVLDNVARRIGEGVDLEALRTQIGPQLLIGEPHRLLKEPGRSLIDQLRRRFLFGPTQDEQDEILGLTPERESAGVQIDRLLGGLLLAPGPKPMRKVTPERLYEDRAPRIFSGQVPALARAVRAPKHDILIDGVVIELPRLNESLRVATVRIDRAFWYYQRAKAEIKRESGRGVVTVGLLMDGSKDKDATVEDARLYIKEAWERHADHVIDARKRTELQGLQSHIAELTA